jgi:hypothetical protein
MEDGEMIKALVILNFADAIKALAHVMEASRKTWAELEIAKLNFNATAVDASLPSTERKKPY